MSCHNSHDWWWIYCITFGWSYKKRACSHLGELRPLKSSMIFFYHSTSLSLNQLAESFINKKRRTFLVHKCKMCVRNFRKQSCCPRWNNAKLPWLACWTQDYLADASFLASNFPSAFQCDINQAISATKFHQALKSKTFHLVLKGKLMVNKWPM